MEPSKPSEDAPSGPLMEALRKQLQSILEKPLTPRTLLELEQTARLSRDLLVVGKVPEARGATGLGGIMASPGVFSTYGIGYGGVGEGGPYTSSPPAETFGATMVRELVGALPALMKPKEVVHRESASSLVDAIAAAREHQMDDIADKLKAKLEALLEEPEEPVVNTGLKGGGVPLMAGPGGYVHIEAEPIVGVGTIQASPNANGASS